MQIFRMTQLVEATGLSKSTIYRLVAAGTLAKPIQLSPRCVGWLAEDVEEFIQQQTSQTTH